MGIRRRRKYVSNRYLRTSVYSVSQKIPPPQMTFSPKLLGIFRPNFTRLLYVPIYAGLQIFIQLPATLTIMPY